MSNLLQLTTNILQLTAIHCNSLHHRKQLCRIVWWRKMSNLLQLTATHWNSLELTGTHCTTKIVYTVVREYSGGQCQPYCNTAKLTTTHCNSLQLIATHCDTQQLTATHCDTLQLTATHCNSLQHKKHLCGIV